MIGLAASTYHCKTKAVEREKRDLALREVIDGIHAQFPGYGHRRIREHLRRIGSVVNKKRLRRVISKYGLFPVVWRTFVATTDSRHNLPIHDNLIGGLIVTTLNKVWVADITYIRIATCFVYLAVILDLCSRKVIGWSLSRNIDHTLSMAALTMALRDRQPPSGCIHHSDRGSQYACAAYVDLAKSAGMRISMSAKGNPYDNAHAESFMKTLKYEEVHLWNYETYGDVLERIPYFLEEVYNKKRLHSSLGYLPPTEFEDTRDTVNAVPVLTL
jgi:putative transposase